MLGKILPLIFLGIGAFVVMQVILPVISYKVLEISLDNQNIILVSPNPGDSQVLGVSVKSENNFSAFISNNKRETVAPYDDFKVSIPSLRLEKLKAVVDSNSFDEHLGHLPGSALPGEKGNVFITGHSSLPQFFRDDNYKAIFSNLPNIKKGDSVIVEAGGQRFEYLVEAIKIVDPKNTSVINPPDDRGRYLTLMTCVPPGLQLKRLIVLAKLK